MSLSYISKNGLVADNLVVLRTSWAHLSRRIKIYDFFLYVEGMRGSVLFTCWNQRRFDGLVLLRYLRSFRNGVQEVCSALPWPSNREV